MSNVAEKIIPYLETLKPALDEIRSAFVGVVNQKEDVSKLLKAIKKLDEVRLLINSAENIGFAIGFGQFTIATFPLTGNPDRDLGQMKIDLPES